MKKLLLLFVLISTLGFSQTTVPLKVTGTVVATPTGTQAVSGTVSIANTPTNVNVTATVNTGTVSSGALGAKSENTITTSASPDYSANDNVGGVNTMTLVGYANGASGYIYAVGLWDKTGTAPALTIDYWDTSPSGTYTDNAAEVIAGDLGVYLGTITIAAGDWVTTGATSRCLINKVLPFKCTGSIKSIYFTVLTTSAYNAASTSDIKTIHYIQQNVQ